MRSLALSLVVCLIVSNPVYSQSYTGVVIDGQANIFGAGFGDTPAPGGGTGGVLAPVAAIGLSGPLQLTFSSVTGQVSCAVPEPFNTADGGIFAGGVTNINSHRDLAGIIHSNRTMFLVGVFRNSTPGNPAGTPPARLGFSDPENFGVLSPLLNQVFFIGNGLTDNTNTVQSFLVPTGSTQLFLGFADGNSFVGGTGHYGDNSGQLVADFAFTAIPEPSTYLLVGSVVTGVALYRLRKQRQRKKLLA